MDKGTYGMSDDLDNADKETRLMLEATLSNVDTEVPDNNTGRCIWCEAKVKDNRRWCSIECRDEHTKYANKL
tara:strand:- start:694 stop:909 length:216 start_codon:yes stop_codon:yes gene_type:complete